MTGAKHEEDDSGIRLSPTNLIGIFLAAAGLGFAGAGVFKPEAFSGYSAVGEETAVRIESRILSLESRVNNIDSDLRSERRERRDLASSVFTREESNGWRTTVSTQMSIMERRLDQIEKERK